MNEKLIQARESLVQTVLDEVRNISSYSDFKTYTFFVIAKFGHQIKAKQENLFANGDWCNPECKEALIRRVGDFLVKHIK